jgi:hypothetical protein
MCKSPYVYRYRIRNWPEYNRALIKRGRLTVWFDERAITAWRHTAPATGPGAPRRYGDLAIECAVVFKSVYHLSLRAAQGFLSSVVELMKLALPIPDYSLFLHTTCATAVRFVNQLLERLRDGERLVWPHSRARERRHAPDGGDALGRLCQNLPQ